MRCFIFVFTPLTAIFSSSIGTASAYPTSMMETHIESIEQRMSGKAAGDTFGKRGGALTKCVGNCFGQASNASPQHAALHAHHGLHFNSGSSSDAEMHAVFVAGSRSPSPPKHFGASSSKASTSKASTSKASTSPTDRKGKRPMTKRPSSSSSDSPGWSPPSKASHSDSQKH